jgi:hypothetical protein
MNSTTTTSDFAIYLLVMLCIAVFEAIRLIINTTKTGIFISQRQLLLRLKNAELKNILKDMGIAPKKMNKAQMVEAILAV